MRASEFIFEVSNPSGPPPRAGDSEFIKSSNSFAGIVNRVVKNFNDELTYLARTNPTEFNRKTTDVDGLLKELRDEVIQEVIKVGGPNFIRRDVDKLTRAFNLDTTNTTVDPTTKNVRLNNDIISKLSNLATSTWYENRYVRYNNQALWARLSGGQPAVATTEKGVDVAKIDSSAAIALATILGVDVDEPSFWKYIKDALDNDVKRNGIYKILSNVYPTAKTIVTGSEVVKRLDSNAAKELSALLGVNLGADLFWPTFTHDINDPTTLPKLQDIFNRHY